jgi:hypothetical protein
LYSRRMSETLRRPGVIAVGAVVALVLAGSALAGAPRPSPGDGLAPAAQASGEPKASKPPKPPKADKGPSIEVTVTGTVVKGTDDKGRPTYTLTAGGTTWDLSAGPPWFWGDDNPLEASVGERVTVVGSHHADATDLDVDTVDGVAVRAPGRPPWAGGPRALGERHPGWKGDDHPGRGQGRDLAPGQQKQASPTP